MPLAPRILIDDSSMLQVGCPYVARCQGGNSEADSSDRDIL